MSPLNDNGPLTRVPACVWDCVSVCNFAYVRDYACTCVSVCPAIFCAYAYVTAPGPVLVSMPVRSVSICMRTALDNSLSSIV
jgi:hypothetical protein